jgi:hypothetical protein
MVTSKYSLKFLKLVKCEASVCDEDMIMGQNIISQP